MPVTAKPETSAPRTGQAESAAHAPLRVAYILHRFPYLTETFIMREMLWVRAQGVDVHILPLLPPKDTVVHQEARTLLPRVHYSPLLCREVLKAQWHFLRRCPARYLRSLAKAVWQTYREPGVLLRVLALFPKSVYLAQKIEELKIDHVHAHFAWLESISAGIAADLVGVTFSVHPHAFGLFQRNQRDVRCQLENATKVVTISSFHRDYIARLCPKLKVKDIEVVYCGLDTNQLQPASNTHSSGTVQILSVGRLIEKKGFEYLVDACALLARRGVDFHCRIVGNGPRRKALEARISEHGIQDRVTMLGALEQKEVREAYQRSDVFALPCTVAQSGDRDGLPVALVEAMACQLPVVTTSLTGIPDLVQHESTGLFVEERDAGSLADALEMLIADRELRERLGQRARQHVVDQFQIQKTTERLATVFSETHRMNGGSHARGAQES